MALGLSSTLGGVPVAEAREAPRTRAEAQRPNQRARVARPHQEPATARQRQHRRASGQSAPVQRGKASYYGREFNGRRMANGRRFDPRSSSAANRTLPLGTRARVTNLENGRRQTVTIEDRGPHVPGRVLDVSPRTAEDLGMKERGTAPVEVVPVEVPQAGGAAGPAEATGGGGPGPRRGPR
ncbi:septal ring lytic transglycosylase RlpA family protein [Siccirubricoccus sp. G192]|nr:septal ring lytic transglycosylase RlpA family protein [Siccirubricoccus sp. G192]